jgi:hypothetical protein
MKTKHPPGPAMTLGNMRELSVRGLNDPDAMLGEVLAFYEGLP